MRFAKEEQMYTLIARYFEKQNYRVVADKPKGKGVRFRSLKGWTVDILALKKGREPEVIAVEVKNSVGSSAVLDALSKAEIYRNVCTRTYVAFPRAQYRLTRNRPLSVDIHRECERRGIGILEVGKQCKVALQAVPSTLRVDMQREIITELIKETTGKFEGFELEDFARYYSGIDDEIVWHRFHLLARQVEVRLRRRRLFLTHRARRQKRGWWYSFSKKLSRGQRYYHVPHFTLSFWDGIIFEMNIYAGKHLNALRKLADKKPELFKARILGLRKLPYSCEVRIENRRHIRGYETEVVSEYAVDTRYLESQSVQGLREFLVRQIKRSHQRFVIEHLFHLNDRHTKSTRLVQEVQQLLDSLVDFYRYVVVIAE